jgi:hypothetical protein
MITQGQQPSVAWGLACLLRARAVWEGLEDFLDEAGEVPENVI